jgi:hypothetical protein
VDDEASKGHVSCRGKPEFAQANRAIGGEEVRRPRNGPGNHEAGGLRIGIVPTGQQVHGNVDAIMELALADERLDPVLDEIRDRSMSFRFVHNRALAVRQVRRALERSDGHERALQPPDLPLRRLALRFINARSLSRRIRAIGRDDLGLILVSRRACFRIELDSRQARLTMRQVVAGEKVALRRAFEPAAGPPGTRFELRVARWEDGSRAWLDSRGLLHLQSPDSRVPEATLVLDASCVSGWASDGRRWGSSYYVGEDRRSPASAVVEQILHPFLAGLR